VICFYYVKPTAIV